MLTQLHRGVCGILLIVFLSYIFQVMSWVRTSLRTMLTPWKVQDFCHVKTNFLTRKRRLTFQKEKFSFVAPVIQFFQQMQSLSHCRFDLLVRSHLVYVSGFRVIAINKLLTFSKTTSFKDTEIRLSQSWSTCFCWGQAVAMVSFTQPS